MYPLVYLTDKILVKIRRHMYLHLWRCQLNWWATDSFGSASDAIVGPTPRVQSPFDWISRTRQK